jgi:SAM-dependent methyltransferase
MHEKLSGLLLPGRVIDIGGTKNSSYRALLRTESGLVTLNISAEHGGGADILADCNKALPIEDNSFDSLLSVTTLEHIKNDELAVREALRILKPGGRFHILTPFLYREHGSPHDFHRHTPQWWNALFLELGLRDEQFTVEPLVWDEFVSGAALFEGSFRFLRTFVRALFCFPGLLAGLMGMRNNRTFIDTHALGIYISGVKE